MTQPVDFYFWPTPNGQKVAILLEETGFPYNVVPVDLGAGEQFSPEFARISPNSKMPALVDPEGPNGARISLFESVAILIYLAEKTRQLYPEDPRKRYLVLQWLMFQMGGVGPTLGQANHFRMVASEKVPYAIERFTKEATRLYGAMDRHLAGSTYFAGDAYTIADVAIYPWLYPERQGQNMDDYPNLLRWHRTVGSRPAVKTALELSTSRETARTGHDRRGSRLS